MGESSIEWCRYTWNLWTGCTKVPGRPECDNCYAEAWAKRTGHVKWGDENPRRRTREQNWQIVFKWNEAAKRDGVRERVFVNSLSDFFDTARPELDDWRREAFELIRQCDALDFLLLTKRIENAEGVFQRCAPRSAGPRAYRGIEIPPNIWHGITAGTQAALDSGWPILQWVGESWWIACLFLSMEPIFERINMEIAFNHCDPRDENEEGQNLRGVDLVIVGGESGNRSRETDLDHVDYVVEQCGRAEVACFVKQLGAKPFYIDTETKQKTPFPISDLKGGNIADFPTHFRRELPVIQVWEAA